MSRFFVKNARFKKLDLPSSGNTLKHLLDGADETSVASPSCPFLCLSIACLSCDTGIMIESGTSARYWNRGGWARVLCQVVNLMSDKIKHLEQ
jgi:hypothetical protein